MTTKYCPKCDIIVIVREEDTECKNCKTKLQDLNSL